MALLELNPIAQRDLRVWWRNWRAFGLIFVYATLLAGFMGWQYANLIDMADESVTQRAHLADVGISLFRNSNSLQILGWMLIAPALTAASIAGERERGLLESLQLSYLSATRIVGGKLICALGFIVLMLLIPLPIMALCFTLGGLSPGDFLSAAALQMATATTCALIGLAVSAWSHRVNAALTRSFISVLAWGFGLHTLSSFILGNSGVGSFYDLRRFYALRWLNPVTAAEYIGGPPPYIFIPSPLTSRQGQLLATLSNLAPWKICIAFEVILSFFLLAVAIRGTRKSFDAPQWIARKTWVEYLKRLIPQPDTKASVANAGGSKWQQRARHALWWEFPLASWMRFSNPILQREARNKLRWRGTNWKSGLLMLLLGGAGVCCYLYWFAVEEYKLSSRANTGWETICAWMGVTILAAAVLGASAIPREREAGTWEAIGLSLLSKRDILSGKIAPPVLACLLYSIPLWPLVMVCADFHLPHLYSANNYSPYGYSGDYGYGHRGIYFVYILAALIIIAATAWGCTALAMLISWRFQRAAVAVCWTIGLFLALFIAFPLLLHELDHAFRTSTSSYGPDNSTVMLNFSGIDWVPFNSARMQIWRYVHPLLALGMAVPLGHWSYTKNTDPLAACLYGALFPALGFAVVWFIGGLIALTLLGHLMRDAPRQADESQPTSWLYAKL